MVNAEPSAPAACFLCGSDRLTPILRGRDRLHNLPGRFTVARCGCGLLLTRPIPSNLWDYYPHHYAPYLQERVLLLRVKSYLLQKFIVRAVGRRNDLKILDVGCGGGHFLAKLRRPGWTLCGLEPDAGSVERLRARLGVDVRQGVLSDRLFEPGFDVVSMIHVLEHVEDPLADLAEVRRLLRPGGVFIAEVPACDSYGFALGRQRWLGLDLPRHLTHFSSRTLARTLGRAGFRVRELHRRPMAIMDLALIDWKLIHSGLLTVAWALPAWFLQKLFRGSVVRVVATPA